MSAADDIIAEGSSSNEVLHRDGGYTLRRISGRYVVFKGRNRVSGYLASKGVALDIMDSRIRREKLKPRACMRCGDQFLSEGPHNRMCAKCRHVTASAEDVAV